MRVYLSHRPRLLAGNPLLFSYRRGVVLGHWPHHAPVGSWTEAIDLTENGLIAPVSRRLAQGEGSRAVKSQSLETVAAGWRITAKPCDQQSRYAWRPQSFALMS